MITGRGEIQYTPQIKRIVIDFQFKSLKSQAVTKVFDQRLHIQTSLDPIVTRFQNLGIATQKVVSGDNLSLVLIWQHEDISWLFIKFLINGTRFSYHDFEIPTPIFEASDVNKREFLRGLGDVTGFVRNANRDQSGRHRIYIEISNKNWKLPPQICQLVQSLDIPTQNINYGHPNLRGGTGTSWAKEHQYKVYAEDYEEIGFYISHKNEALQELAEFNRNNFSNQQRLCDGVVRQFRIKPTHPHETHEKLPPEINGLHFDSFKQICNCLGCYMQRGKPCVSSGS
jgi:hypothetical protein